jgi:GNAT superfamily N-acetyltransferase
MTARQIALALALLSEDGEHVEDREILDSPDVIVRAVVEVGAHPRGLPVVGAYALRRTSTGGLDLLAYATDPSVRGRGWGHVVLACALDQARVLGSAEIYAVPCGPESAHQLGSATGAAVQIPVVPWENDEGDCGIVDPRGCLWLVSHYCDGADAGFRC